MRLIAVWFLWFGSVLAGGGAGLSPLGVPSADTLTLRCQSGRSIQTFVPNTQGVRLLYRGRVYVLLTTRAAPQPFISASDGHVEWRSVPDGRGGWAAHELYRAGAQRTQPPTLLERCQGQSSLVKRWP